MAKAPMKIYTHAAKKPMTIIYTSRSRADAASYAAMTKEAGRHAVVKPLKTGPRAKTVMVYNVYSRD